MRIDSKALSNLPPNAYRSDDVGSRASRIASINSRAKITVFDRYFPPIVEIDDRGSTVN